MKEGIFKNKSFQVFIAIMAVLASTLTVANFVDDKFLDDAFLTIIPSSPGMGVSVISGLQRTFYEAGESSEGSKVVGVIPPTRGTGGEVKAFRLEFDGKTVACQDVSYGEWNFCNCPAGSLRPTGAYKNNIIGCDGYSAGGDCVSVCNSKPLNIEKLDLTKDFQIAGKACGIENIRNSDGFSWQSPICITFDFKSPVIQPNTITKFILQDCQTDNPLMPGYCKDGICEGNICNKEKTVTIIETVLVEQNTTETWVEFQGICQKTNIIGPGFFDTKEQCESNNVLIKENLSFKEKIIEFFRGILLKFTSKEIEV